MYASNQVAIINVRQYRLQFFLVIEYIDTNTTAKITTQIKCSLVNREYDKYKKNLTVLLMKPLHLASTGILGMLVPDKKETIIIII